MDRSVFTTLLHDFRIRYGDQIANIVQMHSTQFAPHANDRSLRDTQATLQAIIADPEAADLERVDPLTLALLMDPAWSRLRKQSLSALTLEQLTECARYALDHFPRFSKPCAERAEVIMTLSLLVAARAWHAARRNKLLRDALFLVFRVEYERATAIIKSAQREFHAGT